MDCSHTATIAIGCARCLLITAHVSARTEVDDPHKNSHAASLSEREARLAEQPGISSLRFFGRNVPAWTVGRRTHFGECRQPSCSQQYNYIRQIWDDPHKDFHAASLSELEARLAEQLGISMEPGSTMKCPGQHARKADPLRWCREMCCSHEVPIAIICG